MKRLVLLILPALTLFGSIAEPRAAEPAPVDFNRDIRPLLAERCFECHGSDKRRGGLRLTNRNDALAPTDTGKAALVPGKSKESELLHRVALLGKGQMPPKGERLNARQIELLRRWIDDGAKWPDDTTIAKHWAYVKPGRPARPTVKNSSWARNEIDYFILARLEKEGLQPSSEASRTQLMRRVCLDLTGLPPTPAQLDAFLADTSPDAYEKLVERLLASPQYGEKWARHWLDLARYADSNGFQRDGFRDLWAYRDWVVKAFNKDMPFDRFTLEQIAGDLLSDATLDQKIATGFHRCTTVNVEAGTDQEENRVNQVIDRVNTTGTVWLGTSLECAQCHNHKYDPVSQREYYQLFAYFNNTEIETKFRTPKATAAIDFTGPMLELPSPGTAERRRTVQAEIDRLDEEMTARKKDLPDQEAWEKKTLAVEEKSLPANIVTILKLPRDKRNANQKRALDNYRISQEPALKEVQEKRTRLQAELAKLQPPQSLVMKELDKPRMSSIFNRGNFLDRGQAVQPGVPAFLHALPEGPANRLTLGRWLGSKDNPLVARVTVNRWWAEIWGRGLVTTLEDFGTKGEPPTHPELLDWLAVEFMERGWSMKALHRLLVTSATYRQSSKLTPDLLKRDDKNALYARGPRFRMDAEMIRDNALSIAGLLSLKQGGPPVKPYQPDGIWRVTGLVDNSYVVSDGEDRYRRGLYVIWRRSAPYPSFVNFDAPIRVACVVQRSRSNTPLQALTLLNDPVYVEAAKVFAKRVVTELPDANRDERIRHAFRLALSRSPSEREMKILAALHAKAAARYVADPAGVKALLADFTAPKSIPVAEFAAWYEVAAVLLNLDETITKE